jgi:cell wall assembly regulator SMI1
LPLPIRDFKTWLPLLAVMWGSEHDGLASPGSYLAGHVDARGGFGFGWGRPPGLRHSPVGVIRAVAAQTGLDPVAPVRDALKEAAMASISFVAEFFRGGRAVLHLLEFGPAVEDLTAGGIGLGSLVLIEGALPELWRRQPAPAPRARPAASADPELLERTLRARLPAAVGATEAEIAAAEARLGLPLPEELKALYRVTRARPEDWGDDWDAAERVSAAVGCCPLPLDDLHIATAATRPLPWMFAAQEAACTSPSGAVQALVGSPGWLVFGGNGGGDRVAIDLTPGPRGNIGQVIMIWHDERYGAGLFARSLTDLVMRKRKLRGGSRLGGMPEVARVNRSALRSVEAAAGPDLEVLSIGVWEGEPLSLAPVAGLPRLRTLTAYPGTLADPLEVTGLTGLEFLELGPGEWRVLLDAGAVPRTLLAAAVGAHDGRNPLQLVAVANEILALWDRPRIAQTILEGDVSDTL